MFRKHPPNEANLYHLRSLVFVTLGFAGFLRVSELYSLKCCDITFHANYFEVKVRSSKTDQSNKGEIIQISKTDNFTCPYNILQIFFKKGNISVNDDFYLFRQLSFCKKRNDYVFKNSSRLSYTRCREIFRELLNSLGLNADDYGTHSLRRGGATVSAMNNISDRLFKKHGRWKSDKAKDGYVLENIKEKLSVTKNLGL
jgi:integrase